MQLNIPDNASFFLLKSICTQGRRNVLRITSYCSNHEFWNSIMFKQIFGLISMGTFKNNYFRRICQISMMKWHKHLYMFHAYSVLFCDIFFIHQPKRLIMLTMLSWNRAYHARWDYLHICIDRYHIGWQIIRSSPHTFIVIKSLYLNRQDLKLYNMVSLQANANYQPYHFIHLI